MLVAVGRRDRYGDDACPFLEEEQKVERARADAASPIVGMLTRAHRTRARAELAAGAERFDSRWRDPWAGQYRRERAFLDGLDAAEPRPGGCRGSAPLEGPGHAT